MRKLSSTGRREDTLGGRLTRTRLGKGWTQHQLASAVGTSQAVVQRIETGKCRHPRIVNSLAITLEVSPAWLLYGVEVVEDLEEEALETARAWSRLPEPQRRVFKRMITRMAAAKEKSRLQTDDSPSSSSPPSTEIDGSGQGGS